MMRSRHFQFWIARLALAAILLMAFAPTLSRWLESETPRLPDTIAAMCTSSGLSWLKPQDLLQTGQQTPAPTGPMQDEYCGYCPLLASVVPLVLAVILLLPMLPSVRLRAWHAPPQRGVTLLRGLGARGPPILL